MNKQIIVVALLIINVSSSFAQRKTGLITEYITPKRIVWMSDTTGNFIRNAESILVQGTGQSVINKGKFLTISNKQDSRNGIILDFGKEIQGGIEIVTGRFFSPSSRVRIRFGESVSETMNDVGENGATNDHAMRDFIVELPNTGRLDIGDSGFRFARIDLVDSTARIVFKEISAILKYRDIPYSGSFSCNDEKLNKIWLTGAYTVHLNMNEYLMDGIKRDRLVWIGDMHPEVMTINSVFGYNEVVPKSLDLVRDETPLPNWMNKINSYSMWWILIQRDWYNYQGDKNYLKQQQMYLANLLQNLTKYIDENGNEILPEERFLDWPSSENKAAIHAGLQSLMVMSFEAGAEIFKVLGDKDNESFCLQNIEKLKKHVPEFADSKQAAALLAISGLVSPIKANNDILSQNGVHKMSTFYGYYMLIARAMAGDYQGAIDNIREYWGAMLDLGATTFWEDFDIDWTKNAARIDEITPNGKIDVHETYGGYCYKQLRHSFCHGWASGPTAWLTKYVLGINVLEPGCKKILLDPHLGDLKWVKGTFPTPYGILSVEHRKLSNGKIKTTYSKPKGMEVIIKK